MASTVSLTTAIGGGLAAIGAFAFSGLPLAIPAIVGAAYNAVGYFRGKDESIRREAEYLLHVQHPGLSKLLWDLHQKGMPLDTLVTGYDRLVDAMQLNLQDPHGGRYLDEPTIAALMQSAVESDRNLSADTVLGVPPAAETPQQAAPPLPPTVLEAPAATIGTREQATATDLAPLRVENPSNQLETVDRSSPEVSPVPTSIDELKARLKEECAPLLRLIKAPPLRVVGVQRSGKSTFIKRLALLRMALLPDHSAVFCTPHKEAIPKPFSVFGVDAMGKRKTQDIVDFWETLQDEIEAGSHLNQTCIFDEFGSYSDFFPDNETLAKSLKSMMREATKHGVFPAFVLHGETRAFVSGSDGILQVLLNSSVRVETIAQAIDDFGTVAPTGLCKVRWLDGSSDEFTIPQWLTENLLLNFIGRSPVPAAAEPSPVPPADPIDPREILEKSWQATAAAVGHPEATDDHDPVEECILKFLEKRGTKGALVGDLIAHRAKALEGMNSEDLRFYLVLLQEEGKVRSEGSRWYSP